MPDNINNYKVFTYQVVEKLETYNLKNDNKDNEQIINVATRSLDKIKEKFEGKIEPGEKLHVLTKVDFGKRLNFMDPNQFNNSCCSCCTCVACCCSSAAAKS